MKEYKQLSLEERKELFLMKKEGIGVNEIAKSLRRHHTAIRRELKRNTIDERIGYLPDAAHKLALERKAKHGLKISRHPELKTMVIQQLKDGWSPEVIAGRKKQQVSPCWVSHEAIYQFIYSNEGKERGLFKYLLRARPRRGLVHGRKPRSGIPERVSIHDRPEYVATREEFGHLEGDLTFFTENQSMNIGVVVERKTRFIQLFLNQSKHTAEVMKGMFNKLAKLPSFARLSITFDNGLEFARHTLLKRFMDMNTYFCDKHSPWQKGQVEQMNSMLHRYLPKNSNLKDVSYQQIELIQNKLNNRPRKCLGFKTPAEAFNEQLNQFVALQT
jgi:transposase, IS30 family